MIVILVALEANKHQDRTMKQFMAGDIGPGEMGCGIELMVLTNGDHENTKYNAQSRLKRSCLCQL